MYKSETQIYISNIENGRMSPAFYGERVHLPADEAGNRWALGVSSSEVLKYSPLRFLPRGTILGS